MIIKVCDRCGKQYYPKPEFMQAKLPSYSITVFEGCLFKYRQVDLCDKCQDDFAKWMKKNVNDDENKCQ